MFKVDFEMISWLHSKFKDISLREKKIHKTGRLRVFSPVFFWGVLISWINKNNYGVEVSCQERSEWAMLKGLIQAHWVTTVSVYHFLRSQARLPSWDSSRFWPISGSKINTATVASFGYIFSALIHSVIHFILLFASSFLYPFLFFFFLPTLFPTQLSLSFSQLILIFYFYSLVSNLPSSMLQRYIECLLHIRYRRFLETHQTQSKCQRRT